MIKLPTRVGEAKRLNSQCIDQSLNFDYKCLLLMIKGVSNMIIFNRVNLLKKKKYTLKLKRAIFDIKILMFKNHFSFGNLSLPTSKWQRMHDR